MTRKEMMEEIRQELEAISEQCVEEGLPSCGSTYELRAEALYAWYMEAYPDLWED